MAASRVGDVEAQYQAWFTLTLLNVIIGLVIHSFIIGVNVRDWWRGRSVTPVDHIVTSLGISRLCAQCALALCIALDTCFRSSLGDAHGILLLTCNCYFIFSKTNTWLTSLLSIVLCLKISNLHTRLFLYLRRMILQRTGHLIGGSIVFSVLNCLMTTLVNYSGTYNTTITDQLTDCIHVHSMALHAIGTFFPVFFYCISSVLLFVSLYHHTTRMKMSSNLSINLETYYSVMRFIFLTFLYNTVYSAGHLLCAFYYYLYCVNLQWLHIVLEFLPVLHSSYLIYRTAKLRNQMSKVLQNVIDFIFQRKHTEARENIEVVIIK